MATKGKPFFEETPPDDFNPEKPFADPVAAIEQREYIVREKFIHIEEAKILRERLKQCYMKEGVNHYQNCRELVKKYLESIKNTGWGKDIHRNY